MKKLSLLFAGLSLLSAVVGCILGVNAKNIHAAASAFSSDRSLQGSGKIVSRTMGSEPFDAIEASRAVQVVVAETDESGIRIEADDNVMDQLMIHIKDRTLHVGIDKSVNNVSDIHVTVTVPYSERLGSLKASSSAKIRCKQPLKARVVTLKASSAAQIEAAAETAACKIKASSAAKIDASVRVADCEIEASSASKVTVTGAAAACEADLSSASDLSAKKFEVARFDIETSSGASAHVRCTDRLKAKATSGSSIRYTGDCQAESHASSGGSIRKN